MRPAPQDGAKQTQGAQEPQAKPPAAENKSDTSVSGVQTIEHSVQARLGSAGYTEIEMVPTSFLVRAKDPDGNPVILAIGPEAIAAPADAGSDQGNADGPSGGRTECSGAPCPGADEE